MASRGKGARVKGAAFERLIANYITNNTPLEAKRGLGQTRLGGSEVADINVDYIHVETKRQSRCNIKAAMRQALDDIDKSEKDKLPVVITKDDREHILVTMLLDDWVLFFKEYIRSQNEDD